MSKQKQTRIKKALDGRTITWLSKRTKIEYQRLLYLVTNENAKPMVVEMKAISEALNQPIDKLFD